jgi:signal transduction histidine kinase
MWSGRPLLTLGNVVLSMALVSAGILLLDERSQVSSACMLFGSSVLLAAGWVYTWQLGPLPLLSVFASPAGTILAAWAMYCYPDSPRARRPGNRIFTAMLVIFLLGETCRVVTSRPQWNGFAASAWWPALFPMAGVSTAASLFVDAAGISFTVAYLLLWGGRWRQSHGIARTLALPVALAATLTCGATLVELAADIASARPRTMDAIYTVETYLQVTVPAAFVISILCRRFARTRIADLLLRLRGPSRASSITDALREVFEDPMLEVEDRMAGAARADERSIPVGSRQNRLRLPVVASSGELLAVILADPSLSANDDLVRAAVAASSFALENARLEERLAEQLREVHASRLRIIQAGIAERRRLERDLHDGTQQRLLALKIMLAAAESDTADRWAAASIRRIRHELALVIDELRDLAHGIHPAVLGQVGLEQSIRSLAERYRIPIDVDLPAGRFAEATELTAYYVIAEAITNAIKHAQASRISVHGDQASGQLRITISDDGCGGASVSAGTGVRGIIDRARGIGGDAEIMSPPGKGTQILAIIPCA